MSKFRKFKVDLENFIKDLNKIIKINNLKIKELLKLKNKTFSNFVKPLQTMDEKLEELLHHYHI